MQVTILDHPLLQHKLTVARKVETPRVLFKQLITEISSLMTYEITRNLPTEAISIETPVGPTTQPTLDDTKMAIVPILRAGLGMLEGISAMIPTARVGHIGIVRDPETLEAHEYYANFPSKMQERTIFIIDPMLATGGSAVAAIDAVKKRGATKIKLVCILGAPEGVKHVNTHHPDVEIVLTALDEKLNEKGYIVPGLGDAGDRIFGTM